MIVISDANIFIDLYNIDMYEAYAECTTKSLSIQDYSLFFTALENNYTLMSNDKRLRNYAKANHVKVIGIFYIFDKLKEYEKMDDKEMLIKLEKLIDQWIKDNF